MVCVWVSLYQVPLTINVVCYSAVHIVHVLCDCEMAERVLVMITLTQTVAMMQLIKSCIGLLSLDNFKIKCFIIL